LQKDDVIGGVGAIGSTLLAVFGYLWNIGIVQLMFTFLAGSFSTYVIQHRLQIEQEKRRIAREHEILMRDKIYGPLLQSLSWSFEKVRDIRDPMEGSYDKNPLMDIDNVMENHLYLLVKKELRLHIQQIHRDLLKYRKLLMIAKDAVSTVAIPEVRKLYPSAKINYATQVFFILSEHMMSVETINLEKALLEKISPLKSFQEFAAQMESPTIELRIDKETVKNPEKIEEIYAKTESLVWKENRVIVHERHRENLENALFLIIAELEERIIGIA